MLPGDDTVLAMLAGYCLIIGFTGLALVTWHSGVRRWVRRRWRRKL